MKVTRSSSRSATTDDASSRPSRSGFTLVELLVVVVIISLLISLLLPAILGARRTAIEAACSAEINMLGQALESFKVKYGDYPPSRVLLSENGAWDVSSKLASTTYLSGPGESDISRAVLASQTLTYFRRFFPKARTSTDPLNPVWPANSPVWYDFNANGTLDPPYVLQGHECLSFFLGGLPLGSADPSTGQVTYGFTGFSSNDKNPFWASDTSRTTPFFEFKSERLAVPFGSTSGIPAYQDYIGNGKFYAYFSSYGNNSYDPNDVNFDQPGDPSLEDDPLSGISPITLAFQTTFPTQGARCISAPPNPYTANPTGPTTALFQKPNTYQILSAGWDGLYGIGGQLNARGELVFDKNMSNTTNKNIRVGEGDNLTNFSRGRLGY